MPQTTLGGRTIDVNDEGFLTNAAQWDEDLAPVLAEQIGLSLTDEHMAVIRFLRDDHAANGETPTLRRVATAGGFDTKQLFKLFPSKPAKKMSYVAGLPKPAGCV